MQTFKENQDNIDITLVFTSTIMIDKTKDAKEKG